MLDGGYGSGQPLTKVCKSDIELFNEATWLQAFCGW